MLPGFDLPSDWSIPFPWKIMDIGYSSLLEDSSWGVRLLNEQTGQLTNYHVDESASVALKKATEEALNMKPPSYSQPKIKSSLSLEDLGL